MRCVTQTALGFVLAGLIAALSGCGKQETDSSRPGGKKAGVESVPGGKKAGDGVKKSPKDDSTAISESMPNTESEPPKTIPEVKLTEGLRATCLVSVGDAMPPDDLKDLDDKTAPLGSLLGKQATVVFFWEYGENATSRILATTALEDIQRDIFAPFADKGLSVVAIDVGDKPDDIRKAMAEAGAKFPALTDEAGAFFAKVADNGKAPRVYLLDASGKILWFDVEFSRSTRRDLKQAVAAVMSKKS